jgi:hypothetical protein
MPHFFDEYVPYRQFIDSRQYEMQSKVLCNLWNW